MISFNNTCKIVSPEHSLVAAYHSQPVDEFVPGSQFPHERLPVIWLLVWPGLMMCRSTLRRIFRHIALSNAITDS